MRSLGILWAQYGPYHFARAAALKKLAEPTRVHAFELANRTSDYEWRRPAGGMEPITLCPGGVAEGLSFLEVFHHARRAFAELKIEACILPGYAPRQSLAALMAAKSLGIRTVMMNESHAGTARAKGLSVWVKRRLVGLFDTALVGGQPQKRHFASLGMPVERIFTGYDAVDNEHFSARAEEVRSRRLEFRNQYDLPEHYFLSLGRFVSKKNLKTLIRAYRQFLDSSRNSTTHLVLVGSGEEETGLRALCHELQLPVYDKTPAAIASRQSRISCELSGVHFYGFRQIDENPVFYALADAFILPSLWEEWGLVVNEAMACGVPVVVSETAGCTEDLLKSGWPALPDRVAGSLHRQLAQLGGRIRQNGFLFDPDSVESLTGALLALESVPALREIMGKASRVIIGSFSCENFARNALLAVKIAMGEDPISPLNLSQTRKSVDLPSGLTR